MNLKILPLAEEIKMYSNFFTKNLKNYFNPAKKSRDFRTKYLHVNMSIGGKYNVTYAAVKFSTKSSFYLIKLQDKDIIRYAFGKYDALDFQLASNESNPLQPLFIFDFSLKYKQEPYEAVFAKVNKKIHILSKVYGLSDSNIETLNLKYKVYKIEDADYALIDFGNINKVKRFFKTLEDVTEGLGFELDESDSRLTISNFSLNSIAKRDSASDYKYCMVCGSKLEKTIHSALFELSMRFPARCESCLEKIHSLDLYYDIYDEFSNSNTISHAELENKWDDLLDYNLKLLTDNGFLEPFLEGLYKIRANDSIISIYSPLLKPVEEETEEIETLQICSVCGDYFYSSNQLDICPDCLEKQNTDNECRICGKSFDSSDGLFDSDVCSDCKKKQYAIELLHQLLEYVKPGSAFTKDSLIKEGLSHFDLEMIIDNLTKYGLLIDDNENLLILETQHNLNEFIEMYSDNLPNDLITSDDDVHPKQTILSKYLYEKTLDKVFNLIDYQKYVESKQDNKTGDWLLIYKKEGNSISFMSFKTPFEAKMAAVRYLDEHNIIDVVADESEDIFKAGNKILICPVCGKEFLTKSMLSQKYCEDCNNKYSYSEKSVLIGIHQGKYTNQTAIEISNLLDQGVPKKDIAKKLKLENSSFINPILKFLLPDSKSNIEDLNESDTKDVGDDNLIDDINKVKHCAACGKEFIEPKNVSNQKFCGDCKDKYNSFELRVLAGMNEGLYDEELAIKINELLKQGYTKVEIGRKLDVDPPSLINFILKFLLPEQIEYANQPKIKGDAKKVKTCLVCGKAFTEAKQVSGQKYCDQCKAKYSLSEIRVLVGIKNEEFTVETAKEIRKLQLAGFSNVLIGEKLGISSPLIGAIMKFIPVSDDALGDIARSGAKLKNCAICGEEFIEPKNVNSQKYCKKCNDRYSNPERVVLSGVKSGRFNENTAIKIDNYKKHGKKNQAISTSLKVPIGSINAIRDILLPENNHKISEGIFYNKAIEKYFVNLKNNDEVCVGIFASEYEAKSEKHKFLGTNQDIETDSTFEVYSKDKLNIEKIHDKCFVYLDNKLLDIFENEEDANNFCKFFNSLKQSDSHPNKQLFEKDDESKLNIVLKGVISDKDRLSLLMFISTFDCDLNKISCDKLENGLYNVLFDFDLEKSNKRNAMVNLNALGWS